MKPLKHTAVVDWRVWKAATVAADGPPMYPGGPSVKAGDQIYVITTLENSSLGSFSFITPNTTNPALSNAINAARDAVGIRRAIVLEPSKQPGWSASLPISELRNLYAYFERCMIAATFSYQALESFANQAIEQVLTGTHRVKRQKEEKQWTSAEIERKCSTEEKLGTILPELTGSPLPRALRNGGIFPS